MKTSATALLALLIFSSSSLDAGEMIDDYPSKAVSFETPPPAVTPYFDYVFDYFHNTSGGFQTGGTAMGTFDVGAEIDLEVLFDWEGATFVVSAFAGHGGDFSENLIGDLGVVSNIYTNTNFNVYYLYFEQALGEGDSLFRIGQFAIDDDFMVSEPGSLFIGAAFGPFNTQSANMPGPIFPLAAPGVFYRYSPTGDWYIQSAAFTGDAGPGGAGDRGFDWNFGGPSGFAVFSEAGFNFLENSVAKIGGYWHSGDFTQFSTGNAVDGLGAIYGIIDHRIIDGGEESQCLDVFVRGSIAGRADRVVATSQVDAGLVASHLFIREDALGIAVNHTTFGDDYLNATPGMTGSETVLEATYRLQVHENFAIQPDVQYILGPHFSGRDALAVGIRGEISF